MKKTERSHAEIVIDWFSEGVWGTLLKKDIRLRKLILKGGLSDWLIVISVYIDDEPLVAFVGAPTMLMAIKKLRTELNEDSISWKPDKYAGENVTNP